MELTLHEAQVAYAELIVELGIVELDAMNDWLTGLSEVPLDLATAICAAGLVSEFELTRQLAQHFDLSIASDIELDMYAQLNPSIPRELCVELTLIPLNESFQDPFPIAMTNPLDEEGLAFVCEQVGAQALKIHLAEPSHIAHEITACYGTAEQWADHVAQVEAEMGASISSHSEPQRESQPDLPALSSRSAQPPQPVQPSRGTEPNSSLSSSLSSSLPSWDHYDPRGSESHQELTRLLRHHS